MSEWEVYCPDCDGAIAGPFGEHFAAARASVEHRIDDHPDADPDTDIREVEA